MLNATLIAAAPAGLDLSRIFASAPWIYGCLLCLSISACVLWLYSLVNMTKKQILPEDVMAEVSGHIAQKRYEAALQTCEGSDSMTAQIVKTALQARSQGSQFMVDAMRQEGSRQASRLWQRISLLNDIAVVAPMLGLLGTVFGMFLAFYDSNRSQESIATIFDGLGVAIGTTVAGLVVAILSMTLHAILKHRVVNLMNDVESCALHLTASIETEAAAKK